MDYFYIILIIMDILVIIFSFCVIARIFAAIGLVCLLFVVNTDIINNYYQKQCSILNVNIKKFNLSYFKKDRNE